MWFHERVFYQIYTLKFTGAPFHNDNVTTYRMAGLKDYADYLQDLGIQGVYFNPVFSSDTHGYDTRDYRRIDERLGTNEDFREIVRVYHEHDIKVVLDGVFNHVGRGFFAFEDVKARRWDSPYKDWFRIDFHGDSPYHDGFWYEGWEGHYELVKLNLENPDVQNYLKESIRYWIEYFDIDGIRLDVAYLLPRWFMAMISDYARSIKPDFFMLGEVLGDNAGYMFHEGHLDSITDYPGFKGFWSSFNSLNLFEIAHTLKRNMFDMYRGHILWTFLDNHDVTRIASQLSDSKKLPLLFGLQLSLPGIPCIYYASEWGMTGRKIPNQPDDDLRPEIKSPVHNDLSVKVKGFIDLRKAHASLSHGSFQELILRNRQWVFLREHEGEKIVVALNIDDQPYQGHLNMGDAVDLLTNETHNLSSFTLPPLSISYFHVK